MTLGDWASIATLALFVIYFAGRIITIYRFQSLETNEVHIMASDADCRNYEIIEDFFLDETPTFTIVIKSITGIRSLIIFRLIYDSEMNIIGREATEHTISFINIGHAVAIHLTLPECLPRFELEYQTMDYKKVSLQLVDNLRNGIISQGIVAKHTFKSVFYNLLK